MTALTGLILLAALSFVLLDAFRDARKHQRAGEEIEIPCIIGGQRVKTDRMETVVMPHDHGHVLARFHVAGPDEMNQAIAAALDARREWENMRLFDARSSAYLQCWS